MDRLLQFLLSRFIRRGTFRVTTSRGQTFACGDGSGRPVAVRFTTRAAELGILLDPELKFGEAYMDGRLTVEEGTIADVLEVLLLNMDAGTEPWLLKLRSRLHMLWRPIAQFNPARRARKVGVSACACRYLTTSKARGYLRRYWMKPLCSPTWS